MASGQGLALDLEIGCRSRFKNSKQLSSLRYDRKELLISSLVIFGCYRPRSS